MGCMNAAKRRAKKAKKRQELEEAKKATENSLVSEHPLAVVQETLDNNASTLKEEEDHSRISDFKAFMDESDTKVSTFTPNFTKPIFPKDLFLQIFDILLKDIPRGNFAESEKNIVQSIVAAICLGLTNTENWALLHRATKTPRTWPIWVALRGFSKYTKTRRLALEKCLIPQLQSWMLPKYRVARIANLGHGSVLDFEVPRHTHGNTLFLSREIYGDGLDWDEEEIRLVRRYTDRKIILHRAHCYPREKRPMNLLDSYFGTTYESDSSPSFPYTTWFSKLPRELRPPKPFGMGEDWYEAAAISYYNKVVVFWKGWDGEGTQRAWSYFQKTDVHAWAMNRDSDESHAPEVLKVKKELRKVESTYNPPRGLVSRKSKSKAKEK
ncbi:hypothetical protein ACHAPC_009958 [Botrytis cinerea]|uniref:Uncharacterized protein n=2 Tax=Botryotinia fuckeliana TaxID=40559 RepID=G2YUD3_BOTF4|nr:hypothetical protein BcDW1_8875 [Botrytis cinerea BcDW1]CCD55231.1 hypothetical protein BofuT4_P156270.1 [Botrytis cinerea T4]